MTRLVHINGRPGVGKKTIAEYLAPMIGARLFDNHLVINAAQALWPRGTAGYAAAKADFLATAEDNIRRALAMGQDIVMTNCLTNEEPLHRATFERLKTLSLAAGAEFLAVTLECGTAENKRRLQNPARMQTQKLTDAAILEKILISHSMIAGEAGLTVDVTETTAEGAALLIAERIKNRLPARPRDTEHAYTHIMLSLRQFAAAHGFEGVVVGASGGIDSSLTTVLAADALGADKVKTLMLPMSFTRAENREDAARVAKNTGVLHDNALSIDGPARALLEQLENNWQKKAQQSRTFENIQARLRTLILMAVANEENRLMLNTSNRSEAEIGHATLYGDTAGGFAPLRHVFKTDVYTLARWRNAHVPDGSLCARLHSIPTRCFTKAPTPELGPVLTDHELLPPYPQLDGLLHAILDLGLDDASLQSRGYDVTLASWARGKISSQAFKKAQIPPGPDVPSLKTWEIAEKSLLLSGDVFTAGSSGRAALIAALAEK